MPRHHRRCAQFPSARRGQGAVTYQVIILAVPGALLLDVAGPAEVFAAAQAAGGPAYQVRLASPYGGPVAASNGITLQTEPLAQAMAAAGAQAPCERRMLIVAGGPGARQAAGDAALACAVAEAADGVGLVASVCTGAFILAASGLLDGLAATTHWRHAARLARDYPAVRVDAAPIFLRAGRIWTSAGVTAGIDMALAILDSQAGRPVAMAVARGLVMFLRRPGGQAQFSAPLAAQARERAAAGRGAARFDALHGWIAANLTADLRIDALAAQAGMSPRSFARHYLASTGRTPARMVAELRLSAARALLEENLPLAEIARRCGFRDAADLRRGFIRGLGVSPAAYAARFGASGPAASRPGSAAAGAAEPG